MLERMWWLRRRLAASLHDPRLLRCSIPRYPRWQHTCAPDIRTMLALVEQPLLHTPDVELAVSRYDECLRAFSGVSGVDATEVQRVGRRVAWAAAEHIARLIEHGECDAAARALAGVVESSCDQLQLLATRVVGDLEPRLNAKEVDRLFSLLLTIIAGRTDQLSEPFMYAVVGALSRTGCFSELSMWEHHLSSRTISAKTAQLVLAAIRSEQKAKRLTVANDVYYLRARRVVRLLAHSKKATTDLATLFLEIELSSFGRRLPQRPLGAWLRWFHRLNVAPGARAFTMLVHAHCVGGDAAMAMWLYGRMEQGHVHVEWDDGSEEIQVPRPNSVTVSVVAQLRVRACAPQKLSELLTEVERGSGVLSQQLVTRAMARAVDCSDLGAAEVVWCRYACQCSAETSNARALAKLVSGYAQAGAAEKAVAFFAELCRCSGPDVALTGVFSAVLRCAIHASGPRFQRQSLSQVVLKLAQTNGIAFDVTTYNVLFAALSQVARRADPAELPKIASVMFRFFTAMCNGNTVPDDTSVAHVVPLCVYMGKADTAVELWQVCASGRGTKVQQLRRHVLAQARNWNVTAQVNRILD